MQHTSEPEDRSFPEWVPKNPWLKFQAYLTTQQRGISCHRFRLSIAVKALLSEGILSGEKTMSGELYWRQANPPRRRELSHGNSVIVSPEQIDNWLKQCGQTSISKA